MSIFGLWSLASWLNTVMNANSWCNVLASFPTELYRNGVQCSTFIKRYPHLYNKAWDGLNVDTSVPSIFGPLFMRLWANTAMNSNSWLNVLAFFLTVSYRNEIYSRTFNKIWPLLVKQGLRRVAGWYLRSFDLWTLINAFLTGYGNGFIQLMKRAYIFPDRIVQSSRSAQHIEWKVFLFVKQGLRLAQCWYPRSFDVETQLWTLRANTVMIFHSACIQLPFLSTLTYNNRVQISPSNKT